MLAVIVGICFIVVGLWGILGWWSSFVIVFKGLVPVMFACGGLLAVIAGATSIRDEMELRATREAEEKKK